ncbi:MAG TPA: HAD-IB family phosphatase [Blastocatellia bacterium]|nr:HAD-IB family phosphatase [Blastocatellia bacterium]
MNKAASGSIHIFTDFDGTVTEKDTLIFLTTHLGGGAKLIETMGRLVREGQLTLRDCIAGEMRSIRAPFAEAVRLLRKEVQVDPGFAPFARWCEEKGLPLTVLSAGFREIIDLFISPSDFPQLEILANSIRPDEQRGWQCVFRDRTHFGHDKAATLREAKKKGLYTVFIGDGLSDRAPAEIADEVFAKHGLAEYCKSAGINCHEYRTFDEVLRQLKTEFDSTEQAKA